MTEQEWIDLAGEIHNVPAMKRAMDALRKCVPLLEKARREMQSITAIHRKWVQGDGTVLWDDLENADDADMALRKIVKLIDKTSKAY